MTLAGEGEGARLAGQASRDGVDTEAHIDALGAQRLDQLGDVILRARHCQPVPACSVNQLPT